MKKFLTINELVDRLEKGKISRFNSLMEQLTFFRIFIFWTLVIIIFGVFYYVFSSSTNYLFYPLEKRPADGLLNHIYFSFITATSTGFGDIVPLGYFKIISIFEVVFGLLLLAFVTSKLVSLKQNLILNEIYEISFTEKISRVRSSLLLFRQNLNRLIHAVEEKTVRSREFEEIYIHLSNFEDILQQIYALMLQRNHHYTKSVSIVDTELILNSIIQSFERMLELIKILDKENLQWRKPITLSYINKCLRLQQDLFRRMDGSLISADKNDFKQRSIKLMGKIQQELREPKAVSDSDVHSIFSAIAGNPKSTVSPKGATPHGRAKDV